MNLSFKQKNVIRLFFLFTFFVLISATLLPFNLPIRSSAVNVEEVNILNGSEYFNKVRDAIANAKERILVYMFIISAEENSMHPVHQLIEELKRADLNGVDVMVVMDERFKLKNEYAYSLLKKTGVKVRYDATQRILHSKLVIADNTVFIGSANWSAIALSGGNAEATAVFDNPQVAENLYSTRIDFFDQSELSAMHKAIEVFMSEANAILKSEAGGKVRRDLTALGLNSDELISSGVGWIPSDEEEFKKIVLSKLGVSSGWTRWGLPSNIRGRLILPGEKGIPAIVDYENMKLESGKIITHNPALDALSQRLNATE